MNTAGTLRAVRGRSITFVGSAVMARPIRSLLNRYHRSSGLVRGTLLVGIGVLGCVLLSGATQADGNPQPFESLFQPDEFPKGWVFYSEDKDAKLEDIWKVVKEPNTEDAVLVCTGKHFGYIRTTQLYENYELGVEWKYPKDPNANSGILIHTTNPDKIWPKSIQVQLHRPMAGTVFPDGGAKVDNPLQIKDLELPINTWHKCVIRCEDDRITVTINGRNLGEVTGCNPHKGSIALQSEGSEIHFRRIRLRKLK